MTPIEIAILRTILYGDVFNFAMSYAEIHHFLIYDRAVNQQTVLDTLNTSTALADLLTQDDTYVACKGREALIDLRHRREHASQQMWSNVIGYGHWLARLPFVRMVAITGALSMHNSDADDDYDYILVTAPGRVWLARAFAILLVRLSKIRGVTLCPNYVLAEDRLEQQDRNLYIAHEIVQMLPLYGRSCYDAFRWHNLWADSHLPNANQPFYDTGDHIVSGVWRVLKTALERLLGGRLGDRLEQWERQRKMSRFQQHLETPHSSARLDDSQVKGHFQDYGYVVLEKYYERLRRYNVDELPLAGD